MKTNSTQENWKKYFYSGIGYISHTGDVVQKSLKEISQKGNMNVADGREIVNNALHEIEQKYNEALHKFMGATGAETAKLQSRLTRLEKQLILKPNTAEGHIKEVTKSSAKSRVRTQLKRNGLAK